MRATVNISGSRSMSRVDMGFYMGTILGPLLFLYKTYVLLANQKHGPFLM